jgi:hypothetical protein
MNCWQLIFLQSKVNRGAYDGDRLPTQNWDWPQRTWFQKRLRSLRETQQHVLRCKDRTGLEIASQSQREYKEGRLQEQTAFKEIGNGVPTMFARQRSQVPGLY